MMRRLTMRHTVKAALVLVSLGSMTSARVARADDDLARRQVFEQGRTAMQAGRWEDARSAFQQLFGERRTYDVALQLGQAEYNLKRLRDCAEHLAYGLRTLPPREKPETAERSRQILALCKQGAGTLELRATDKGAEVFVDGKLAAETPLLTELFLEPGEHRFEVRLDGRASEAFTLQLNAGQTRTRSVELKPLIATVASAEPIVEPKQSTQPDPHSPPAAPAPQPPTHASWVPVVAGGLLSIAGLSSGVGFLLVANARENEASRIRSQVGGNGCLKPSQANAADCGRLSDLESEHDSFARLDLISFIVGGAALIGTGTYFLVARPDQARSSATASSSTSAIGPLHISANASKDAAWLRVGAVF
jgi:hypothetical protein